MSRSKRPQAAPARGDAGAGAAFDPGATDALPDTLPSPHGEPTRAMPAPQTPLSEAELKRLKSRAARGRAGPPVAGQADPGGAPTHRPRKKP